ncbi:MAG: leucine-rich repeat domain-containing protein [Bacteroidaceae bacterium]|nr:leucine-rich repeat domain-containing protein [Bacteroidaceae bacterium]
MAKYKISKNGVGSIPKGETFIDDSAFKMCKKLTSIVIPDGVLCIESEAFSGCINLKEITIPNSIEYIYSHAFAGCKELTSIVIPESVKSLHRYLFPDCDNLSSIVVDEENNKYDSRNNCNAIIETESNTLLHGCANTIIPDSVTEIAPGAFTRCKNLTSISIPNNVKSIGNGAFFGCENLNNIIIPESVKFIDSEAFARCNSLTTITIPDGVNIAENAFEGSPCNNKGKKLTKEKKSTVTFSYEGQLDFYIDGECTLELTSKELELFKKFNQQAKDEDADDILAYFEEQMPESLYDKIEAAINNQIRYNDSEEMIEQEGINCFPEMSQKVFDSMTMEELIERYMDDNCDGIYEFIIENIEINE